MMLRKCFVWRRIRSEGTESCSEKFVTAWLNDFEIGDVGFRIIESLLKVRFQKLRERTDSRIRLRVMRQSSRLHALIYLKCWPKHLKSWVQRAKWTGSRNLFPCYPFEKLLNLNFLSLLSFLLLLLFLWQRLNEWKSKLYEGEDKFVPKFELFWSI